jgi:hypothetical protein
MPFAAYFSSFCMPLMGGENRWFVSLGHSYTQSKAGCVLHELGDQRNPKKQDH